MYLWLIVTIEDHVSITYLLIYLKAVINSKRVEASSFRPSTQRRVDSHHSIQLTDDRPFRLPYRWVPRAHYEKLRQVLTDMEERGIIRKSSTEYASPLVMVWKKDGGLVAYMTRF